MRAAFWIRLVLVVGSIAVLEIACRSRLVPDTAVIAPSLMGAAAIDLLISGELGPSIRQTFASVGIAIAMSVCGGFLAGFWLHRLPRLRRAINPFLAAYYAIPTFAFYPLLVVIFGFGPLPLIVLATLFAIVAMIVATMAGLDRVPRVLLKTSRVHHLSPFDEMWRIRLPAAGPYLFSGVKLSISYSFVAVIAGEFILSTVGLGHEIAFSYDNFDNRRMYGLIIFVLGTATAFNMLVYAYERHLARRRGS